MEVPAPVAGTVTGLWVAVGDTVRTSSPILLIEAEGGDAPAARPESDGERAGRRATAATARGPAPATDVRRAVESPP